MGFEQVSETTRVKTPMFFLFSSYQVVTVTCTVCHLCWNIKESEQISRKITKWVYMAVLERGSRLSFIFTRDSIYAIARICYRPSVRPSVTRVYHRKTPEVRIMKFSPYGSPIPLVFRDQVLSRNSGGSPTAGC